MDETRVGWSWKEEMSEVTTRFFSVLDGCFLDSDSEQKKTKEEILKAYYLMFRCHFCQERRLNGELYLKHILEVAIFLMETLKQRDPELIITSLFHDIERRQRNTKVGFVSCQKEFWRQSGRSY